MRAESIAGVVLAGGRSQRMGGRPKALLKLGDRTLLERVIERMRPQVGRLLLSVESASSDWAGFGLEQVSDPAPGFRGPLGGLLAALEALGTERYLALAPCDAPFLPADLVERLLLEARASAADAVTVSYEGVPQPTFSLWRRSLAGALREAVFDNGMSGFREFLATVAWSTVDWPVESPPPFFNINDPAALALVRGWLGAAEEGE